MVPSDKIQEEWRRKPTNSGENAYANNESLIEASLHDSIYGLKKRTIEELSRHTYFESISPEGK
jgi:hypothetical protein